MQENEVYKDAADNIKLMMIASDLERIQVEISNLHKLIEADAKQYFQSGRASLNTQAKVGNLKNYGEELGRIAERVKLQSERMNIEG